MRRYCRYTLCVLMLLVTLPTTAETFTLRVMSINTKESGAYDGYKYDGFADLIEGYAPDVVALQEVDENTSRNKNQDWLALLANELNMNYHFGKAIDYQGGYYGVGLLSKYPMIETATQRSEIADLETRACAWATIVLANGESVRFGSVHLSVSNNNGAQVTNFATFSSAIFADDTTTPMVLMGDFNSLETSSTMSYVRLNWKDFDYGGYYTYPASGATSRIDYVMGYPKSTTKGWSCSNYNVIARSDLTDHCFIVADLVYEY